MLLVALAMLIGVATPPVIEDHVEVGFCSADCPVQNDGHTTALAPPPAHGAALCAAPDTGSDQRRSGTQDVNDPASGSRCGPQGRSGSFTSWVPRVVS